MKKKKLRNVRNHILILLVFAIGLLVGAIFLTPGLNSGIILVPHPQFTFHPEERYSVSDSDCRNQAIAKGYETEGLTCALLYVESDACASYSDSSYCCVESAICNCYYLKS